MHIHLGDTVKHEFDWDDEPYMPDLRTFIQGHGITRPLHLPNRERRIAGSKRVARYQIEHGYKGSGQLLQSITAHPALSTRSFEELRLECYAQSLVAQGKPPSVNDVTTLGVVIPPLFKPYHDETEDILPNEIIMAE